MPTVPTGKSWFVKEFTSPAAKRTWECDSITPKQRNMKVQTGRLLLPTAGGEAAGLRTATAHRFARRAGCGEGT